METLDTVAWLAWNADGTPRASKTHVQNPDNEFRTLCGQSIPEPAACSADEMGGTCRRCQKIAAKR